ncbi:hypothetical protein MA6G0728R_4943 [Mycobacteroides abscessus 6G-0728-R]|nr:hypothetical protein MA6G0125S_5010 [Mycobacteroides abscessus 6G-0125-S]EIU40210.1 hypothetical protein MA6G0125R_3972 [Mycobacteroides abscessus 6G-0125-R]EIU52469.1 hypothetical protein MA6G1108_4941 [Mycobacteroides abscessus 6G-1108]EIU54472.1 hypothetical protein MA6G0728S_4701 [Mycobacteroides abscessus 6G-0728-S]EIU90034.1 hypothetical protein MA6G0212_4998 [Mycobacteroides abscessus 6G-0212]EIU96127.1 hypothetical protein MA6G0728R_4943 [Mycobacteroides abscessus 6G-0728-R]EIV2187
MRGIVYFLLVFTCTQLVDQHTAIAAGLFTGSIPNAVADRILLFAHHADLRHHIRRGS